MVRKALGDFSVRRVGAGLRAGFGMAVLPCFFADRDPDLVRCIDARPTDKMELWLVTHERRRHVPRVRVVMDFLTDRLVQMAKREGSGKDAAAWGRAIALTGSMDPGHT